MWYCAVWLLDTWGCGAHLMEQWPWEDGSGSNDNDVLISKGTIEVFDYQ